MDALDRLCVGLLGIAITALVLKACLHYCERALGFQWSWLHADDDWIAYLSSGVLAVCVVVLLVRNFSV